MAKNQEVERLAKKLDKMVHKKNTDGALDLLRELKNIKMSLETLQSTRVGMSVNAVRKHSSDEEVQTLAKALIKSWKKLLDGSEEKKKEDSSPVMSSSSKDSGTSSDKRSDTQTLAQRLRTFEYCGTSSEKSSKKSEDSPIAPTPPVTPTTPQNTPPTPPIIPITPIIPPTPTQTPTPTQPLPPLVTSFPRAPVTTDSVRNKCRELLVAALQTEDDQKPVGVDCENLAAQIEEEIFQELKQTDLKYKSRLRSRISNLKDQRNPELRRNVLCGNISAQRIACMTAEEMASPQLKQMREALTKESIREHQLSKEGGTETDMFICSKCKGKSCMYTQVQIRSADEPMTTFVLCNNCGNRWKFC